MNYENLPCPVCGSHMHTGDDIVFCPDCGTPCHRECWKETGHCINESKHGAGFVWSGVESQTEAPDIRDEAVESEAEDVINCHVCGSENPSTSKNCNHCGALLLPVSEEGERNCPVCGEKLEPGSLVCTNCGTSLMPAGSKILRQPDFMNGIDRDENLGIHKEIDYAVYVRKNTEKYLPKFRSIAEGKSFRFNGAAFFLGPLWFCFRKMYAFGISLLVAIACISLIVVPASEKALDVFFVYSPEINMINAKLNGLKEYTDQSGEKVKVSDEINALSDEEATEKSIKLQTELFTKMANILRKPVLIMIGFLLILAFISGLTANTVYFNRATKDITRIKEEMNENNMRSFYISRRGGTSLFGAICIALLYSYIQSIVVTAAEYISTRF